MYAIATPVSGTCPPPVGADVSPDALLTLDEWLLVANDLRLSLREVQISQALFAGHTKTAIASHLGITEHTVRTHVKRLYRKLSIRDRRELLLRILTAALGRTAPASAPPPFSCADRAALPAPQNGASADGQQTKFEPDSLVTVPS